MIIVLLGVLGLVLGSFVNAFVWRLRQQSLSSRKSKVESRKYSITHGRSMCPNCHYELAPKDLVPLLSWLMLKGKCRYCHKPISAQYPLVEAATALLFIFSYLFWPNPIQGAETAVFGIWLVILVGLMALLVYDIRWMLLPNKMVFPLTGLAAVQSLVRVVSSADPSKTLIDTLMAVAVGGGIFYIIFQLSQGKWIGGGDVKLGFLLGLLAGTPAKGLLFIFLASVLGSLVSLPLVFSKRLKRTSMVAFGPFLIVAGILVVLFGSDILSWYEHTFLLLN